MTNPTPLTRGEDNWKNKSRKIKCYPNPMDRNVLHKLLSPSVGLSFVVETRSPCIFLAAPQADVV